MLCDSRFVKLDKFKVTLLKSISKKCPKCGTEMRKGRRLVSFTEITLAKEDQYIGDDIKPVLCKKCGYIELYMEDRSE